MGDHGLPLGTRVLLGAGFALAMVESVLNTVGQAERWGPLPGGEVSWGILALLACATLHGIGLRRWWRSPLGALGPALMAAPLGALGVFDQLTSPEGVHHGKFLPTGVILAFWVVALRGGPRAGRGAAAIASPLPTSSRGGEAIEAGCGVAAAIYLLAALAKVIGAGPRWFDPSYLGLLVLERSFGAPGPLEALRTALAGSAPACLALATGALLIEAGGVLLLWPRWRRPMAVLLVSLHLGIALAMGYVYVTWMVTVLGLCGWRPR